DEARSRLGAAFDIRDFHSAVLDHGSLPLPVLRQVVTEWATEKIATQVYQECPAAPPNLEVVVTRNGPSASRDARSRYVRRRFSAYCAGRNDPGRSRLVRDHRQLLHLARRAPGLAHVRLRAATGARTALRSGPAAPP